MAEPAGARTRVAHQAAHLVALWSLAVAQPLLDVLGGDPTFFVARDAPPVDVIVLALAWLLVAPALLALGVLALARLLPALGTGLYHLLALVLLATLLTPPLERHLQLAGVAQPLVALGTAAPLWWFLSRHRGASATLALLGLSPLLFGAVFLTRPGMDAVLWPPRALPPILGTAPPDVPVVMLVLDELPLPSLLRSDLSVDAALFPGFARLAARATFYRDASASHESTTWAVPALLTGRAPDPTRALPIAEHHPENLITWLAATHRLHVLETVTRLCPPALRGDGASRPPFLRRVAALLADTAAVAGHAIAPADWRAALPTLTNDWGDFWRRFDSPRLRADALVEWIDAIDDDGRPALHLAHVLLPHLPWLFLPDGRQYTSPDAVVDPHEFARWGDEPWESDQALARHLLQLGFVDTLLERLLDRLEATGLLERCLLVVVADHGASFEPGTSRRAADEVNGADVASIPLFIKRPGQTVGALSDRNLQAIDLMPTLAAALGVALPWRADGVPADDSGPAPEHKTLHRLVGEPLHLPAPLVGRWPLLAHRSRLFGDAPDWHDVYALGRGADLLGRDLRALDGVGEVVAPWPGRVELEGGSRLLVDPGARSLPCFVAGRLALPADVAAPAEVALAVDARVAAVVPVHPDASGRPAFSALLDPASLRPGVAHLDVLAVRDDRKLAPLAVSSDHLVHAADGQPLLRTAAGRLLPFDPAAMLGVVDQATVQDDVVLLSGWALDHATGGGAERVLALVDGEAVGGSPTGRARAGLDAFGAAPDARAGFRFELPRAALPPGRTRLLMVGRDAVAELEAATAAQWLLEVRHELLPTEPPVLVGDDGSRRPLDDGVVTGVVDVARWDDGSLELLGWAADRERGLPPDALLVMVDGRQVVLGRHWLPHDGVADALGSPGLAHSGFRYRLPIAERPEGRVRVLALSGTHAAELGYAPAAAWLRSGARAVQGSAPLALCADGAALVGDDGAVWLAVDHVLGGSLDAATLDAEGLHLLGWTGAPAEPGPVDALALLLDGRGLWIGAPWVPRSDLAGLAGVDEPRWGFDLRVARDRLGDAALGGRIDLWALRGGLGQRLVVAPAANWLAPLGPTTGPVARPRYSLDDTALRGDDGSVRTLRDGNPRGQVDEAFRRDGRLHVVGWAAAPDGGDGAALRVLVLEDDRALAEVPVHHARPDVAALHGRDGLLRAGFLVDVPDPREDASHAALASRLTVVAVGAHAAARLPFESR